MEVDMIANKYVLLQQHYTLMSATQTFCDFDVYNSFGYLGWYEDVMKFICKNHKEIKRKFTMDEFMEFAWQFRVKKLSKFPMETMADFKKIKIRNA